MSFYEGEYGRIFARTDYSYRSSQFKEFSNDPTLHQEGYGILGASLAFVSADERWQLTAGGTNLTDEIYMIAGEGVVSSLKASF